MIEPLVDLISSDPGMLDRILDNHVPDRHGRCKGCQTWEAAPVNYPCVLYDHAAEARDRLPAL